MIQPRASSPKSIWAYAPPRTRERRAVFRKSLQDSRRSKWLSLTPSAGLTGLRSPGGDPAPERPRTRTWPTRGATESLDLCLWEPILPQHPTRGVPQPGASRPCSKWLDLIRPRVAGFDRSLAVREDGDQARIERTPVSNALRPRIKASVLALFGRFRPVGLVLGSLPARSTLSSAASPVPTRRYRARWGGRRMEWPGSAAGRLPAAAAPATPRLKNPPACLRAPRVPLDAAALSDAVHPD